MIPSEQVWELLCAHGECRSQPSSDWRGSIPLPEALSRFYSEVGPVDLTIEGFGNPTFMPKLSGLWEHQAGYRWNAISGEPIAAWDPDWIVVADEGADPFIFSCATETILSDGHGKGSWDPELAYPDLNTMAACIATLGSVVVEAGEAFTDSESYIRPKFRDLALSRLTVLLGGEAEAQSVLENAGWG